MRGEIETTLKTVAKVPKVQNISLASQTLTWKNARLQIPKAEKHFSFTKVSPLAASSVALKRSGMTRGLNEKSIQRQQKLSDFFVALTLDFVTKVFS